jgi:hypothetical protein
MENHTWYDCRDKDDNITWLPKSQIVEFNRWKHRGDTRVRLRLPLWMAKSEGFDLTKDVMGRFDEPLQQFTSADYIDDAESARAYLHETVKAGATMDELIEAALRLMRLKPQEEPPLEAIATTLGEVYQMIGSLEGDHITPLLDAVVYLSEAIEVMRKNAETTVPTTAKSTSPLDRN